MQMQMPFTGSRGGSPSTRLRGPLVACAAVVLGVSVQSGVQAVSQGNKLLLVVPLAGVVGRSIPPAADGQPYVKESAA